MAIDWVAVRDDVIAHARALIRFDTTNPPGNESEAAAYLVAVARHEGLEAALVESAPGRGNAVVRLRAARPAAKPLLLMGHLDVVGVERDKWSRDPFGGDVIGGFVWGRGALDMKGQVAAELTALLLLKRSGVALDRDVIFAAFADEEVSTGEHGAIWMRRQHRDLIDAEFALNEGGGWQSRVGPKRFYLCQVGEKGASRLRITARGPAGHASVPLEDTAMARLGVAMTRLHQWQPPIVVTPVMRRMLETMGTAFGERGLAAVRGVLAEPTWGAIDGLPLDADTRLELRALLANTAVPTILRGGSQINVIPSEVSVDVDGRILPGVDPEAFRQEVQTAIGDVAEVALISREEGIVADPESPLFDAIAATMAELDPGCAVAPFLSGGGTDAKALPGIKVYGFFPYAPSDRQSTYIPLVHGHDERIAVEDLVFGTRFFSEVVIRFAGAEESAAAGI
jgi:acetylornithine deacetylase/succinyl-diaminopimelate desuccinylase-like protein